MYKHFYNLAMYFLQLFIMALAPFKEKMRKRREGEKAVWAALAKADKSSEYVWFHAASLGEFEQGRPIIEALRKAEPTQKILLTFFSPSGYEICKNYDGADLICYLPVDTRRNAKRFLRSIRLKKVIFIKYEFWRNFLFRLHREKIPVYLVSAIFREKQAFFCPWLKPHRNVLNYFEHFFVQDENSKKLLESVGFQNVTISGDTRFDRVRSIANLSKTLPEVEKFVAGEKSVLVAGSSWEKDEAFLLRYFHERENVKLIIAPHEINSHRLERLCAHISRNFVLLSQATDEKLAAADCLIIDGFGLLSSVYKYGKIAYIGGGFGAGIHNTLEAAVWGMPVVFGWNYQKFKEARELISCGAAFSFSTYEELEERLDLLIDDSLAAASQAKNYVEKHSGATAIIMKEVFKI